MKNRCGGAHSHEEYSGPRPEHWKKPCNPWADDPDIASYARNGWKAATNARQARGGLAGPCLAKRTGYQAAISQ
jgi:hypothetical protein